jgi:hypothetical protein
MSPNPQSSPSTSGNKKEVATPTLAPEDFYMENGSLVFTAAYHLKRGSCCDSGCRHCPYRDNP